MSEQAGASASTPAPGNPASDTSRGGVGAAPLEPPLLPPAPPLPTPPPHSPQPIVPGAKKLYFVNGFVDFMLVGGASIITFICLRNFHSGERTSGVIMLAAQLMWVVNWPHFAATNYRLYHSKANIGQYPLTALAIPWVVLAGVIGSLVAPDRFAPIFVMIYLLWSPYHFSGQTVGVTMIYARRSGFKIGKTERFFLSSFIFGTFICTSIRAHVDPSGTGYYGVLVPGLGLPAWTERLATMWVYASGFVFLLFVLKWCIQNQRGIAPIVLLPAISQYVWFMPGGSYASFNEFVPLFHSVQYLLIAWAMQLKERVDQGRARATELATPLDGEGMRGGAGTEPNAPPVSLASLGWLAFNLAMAVALNLLVAEWTGYAFAGFAIVVFMLERYGGVGDKPSVQYAVLESLRWMHRNFGVGVLLFFLLPKGAANVFETPETVAIGVVTAGVQIHHFFVDGVIWKLKSANVSSPLMVNIDDLIKAPQPPAPAGASMASLVSAAGPALAASPEQRV